MNQEKIVKIIVFFVIIIVGAVSIHYAFKENPLSNIPGISLPTLPSIDLGIVNYENKNLGIKFSYPNEILQLSESGTNINLKSKYFIDADMSGIPGNEKIHYFGFNFELKKSPIFEAIEQELPSVIETAFPGGKLENFQPGEGFTEKGMIANKDAYSFLLSVESINVQYIFIAKNPDKTLLIKFMYIGDFLKPEISETEQKAIFEFIMTTLKFI